MFCESLFLPVILLTVGINGVFFGFIPHVFFSDRIDKYHIRMGTETELVDVISHHVAETGDPTRYGTITNTDITVTTTQIQHPFREVLALAQTIAGKQTR